MSPKGEIRELSRITALLIFLLVNGASRKLIHSYLTHTADLSLEVLQGNELDFGHAPGGVNQSPAEFLSGFGRFTSWIAGLHYQPQPVTRHLLGLPCVDFPVSPLCSFKKDNLTFLPLNPETA